MAGADPAGLFVIQNAEFYLLPILFTDYLAAPPGLVSSPFPGIRANAVHDHRCSARLYFRQMRIGQGDHDRSKQCEHANSFARVISPST